MNRTLKASFNVTGWDEMPYDEPANGPKLSQVQVEKTFTGSLEGTSTARVLMCMSDASDYTKGAGYIGSEKFEGAVDGRQGSFVFQHGGLSGPDISDHTFGTVVPGSATDALAGLEGTVRIHRDDDGSHSIELTLTREPHSAG